MIGKIWQKLKDLYGWDRSCAFYWEDKRAYYKALANSYKKDMEKAEGMKEFEKAKFFYEDYMAAFDHADFQFREYSDNNATEEGWRN